MNRPSAAIALALVAPLAYGQATGESTRLPTVEVTTSKLPMAVDEAPSMITIVTGEDLRARGANDLRTALALVAGVDVAPGGDSGPAGSVPGMWGLREFDAFLLVVDGVPSGGAFNPALTTLDLTNVERIEVLRGAAPVSYGATSFVGVIHVIHYAPGSTPEEVTIGLGSRATAIASVTADLGSSGSFKHSITANAETHEFSQDRSQVDRAHVLYRSAGEMDWGRIHFDVDGTILRQDPYSPHPREGSSLTDRIPLDANHNPTDARADEDRITFTAGLEHALSWGNWVTTASFTHSELDNTRGFLREGFADDGVTVNADGFRQNIDKTDGYFDTYLATQPMDNLRVMYGADWLYGRGEQKSSNFEYAVLPDGSNAPSSHDIGIDERTELENERSFGGLYVQADWQPTDRFNVVAGLRYNHTDEDQEGEVIPTDEEEEGEEGGSDSRTESRWSGVIGGSYMLWQDGADKLVVFADYRNTYKPAAVDLGPEAEGEILEPETANSREFGLKGRLADGRFEWEASYFHMNFANLVIRENVNGLPALANAGTERFTGTEVEASWLVTPDLRLAGSYAYHEAKFVNFGRLRPDGSIQQLGGNFLELSPEHLGALGLIYRPVSGFNGYAVWNYVGDRFLNKGNTSVADSYSTLDAGIGYRFPKWELRLDGYNLTDERDPVAESELGDAQFYRLSGSTVTASARFQF